MLSTIASVITLILFILYCGGRCYTILTVKPLWKDKVIIGSTSDPSIGVVEEIRYNNYVESQPYGYLVSKQGIRDLKIYSVKCIEGSLDVEKGDLLLEKKFLNIDEAIAFYVLPGDLRPTLIIEYITFDYMKVTFGWRINRKSGVSSEFIQPEHTPKSFAYYFSK